MSVNLVLEKPFYNPGEQVNCIIYLVNPVPSPNCRLVVEVRGQESCGFRYAYFEEVREYNPMYDPNISPDDPSYSDRCDEFRTRRVERFKNLRQVYPIFEQKFLAASGNLNAGQFQIPFSFKVPMGVPNSFAFKASVTDYAYVTYEVVTYFQSCIGFLNLRDRDQLIVKQQFAADYAIRERNDVFPLSACCSSKGVMKLKAHFEKTVYQPGETANFLIQVDATDCSVPIHTVSGECTRNITVRCQNQSKTWSTTVSKDVAQGLPAGSHSGVISLHPRIIAQENEMSTRGKTVQCSYQLDAECNTNLSCGSANPTIRLPIIVCRMPTAFAHPFQPPSGWHPTMMQAQVVNFDAPVANISANPTWINKGDPGYVDINVSVSNTGYPEEEVVMGAPPPVVIETRHEEVIVDDVVPDDVIVVENEDVVVDDDVVVDEEVIVEDDRGDEFVEEHEEIEDEVIEDDYIEDEDIQDDLGDDLMDDDDF